MKSSLYTYPTAIGLMAVFFIAGCSWFMSYGKLTPAYGPSEKVTIQELQKNWRAYNVYYAALHAGVSTDHPSAVMFDPKDDDKTVTVSRWATVEDDQSLVEMIDTIQNTYTSSGYYPRLWRLVGPIMSCMAMCLRRGTTCKRVWLSPVPCSSMMCRCHLIWPRRATQERTRVRTIRFPKGLRSLIALFK